MAREAWASGEPDAGPTKSTGGQEAGDSPLASLPAQSYATLTPPPWVMSRTRSKNSREGRGSRVGSRRWGDGCRMIYVRRQAHRQLGGKDPRRRSESLNGGRGGSWLSLLADPLARIGVSTWQDDEQQTKTVDSVECAAYMGICSAHRR